MVREAIFNMLMGELEESLVLDLFAGSGAMGFEALSRGAKGSVFCDNRPEAVTSIKKNVDLLSVREQSRVLLTGWQEAITKLAAEEARFQLIFLDPPYKMKTDSIFLAIRDARLLMPQGIIVLEQSRDSDHEDVAPFSTYKERRYGETIVRLLSQKEQAS